MVAPSGNRTRGISMATRYFTTKPTALGATCTHHTDTNTNNTNNKQQTTNIPIHTHQHPKQHQAQTTHDNRCYINDTPKCITNTNNLQSTSNSTHHVLNRSRWTDCFVFTSTPSILASISYTRHDLPLSSTHVRVRVSKVNNDKEIHLMR